MRKIFLMLAIAGLLAGPTFADIGTVTMDIKVSDDGGTTWYDSLSYANAAAVPSSLLVQVRVGATASGVGGSNNGVQGLFFDLVGDALGTVSQSPLSLKAAFIGAVAKGNMGFNDFTSGGTFDTIGGGLVGIGGAQGAPPGPQPDAMAGAFTANATGNKGLPYASVITDGTLNLVAAQDGVNMQIDTDAAANFWSLPYVIDGDPATVDGGLAERALIVDDSVLIEVLPEPATLLMLAPGLLLALRRRRA